jgi:hypothetical protein
MRSCLVSHESLQAATAELFDQHGQLALRPDLAAAQALCLLVLHECVMRRPTQNDQHMCECPAIWVSLRLICAQFACGQALRSR